jgi:hypothetical protein|tara:strand:- start:456 stop:884 length:429 start_codon:yes stop_codon:yes gene_type:complete
MSFTKSLFNCITFLLVMFLCVELKADENKSKEEPLPLNDPFVGDASLSGGVKVLSDGTTSSEQKRLDIFTYKLTGLVQSDSNSFISLINQDGENVTVEINEEVNEGVKLIDMNQKEVVFLVEETDSYLIMNFKNEIKETSEY